MSEPDIVAELEACAGAYPVGAVMVHAELLVRAANVIRILRTIVVETAKEIIHER